MSASHTWPDSTVNAVGGKQSPANSLDRTIPRWTTRHKRGEAQWVEGRFPTTRTLRSVGVYWFDDGWEVQVPKSWTLKVRRGGKWSGLELYPTDEYGLRKDQYNVVHPAAPLECDAIQVHMTPQRVSGSYRERRRRIPSGNLQRGLLSDVPRDRGDHCRDRLDA